MGIKKKVLTLRHRSSIIPRGGVSEKRPEGDGYEKAEKRNAPHHEEEVPVVRTGGVKMQPDDNLKCGQVHNQVEAIGSGEVDDDESQVYVLPSEEINALARDKIEREQPTVKKSERSSSLPEPGKVQIYEIANATDDYEPKNSVIENENTAFEVLSVSTSKGCAANFSGVIPFDDDMNGTKDTLRSSGDEDYYTCESLITTGVDGNDTFEKSGGSTTAAGPEVCCTENKFVRNHTLRGFFSAMSLIEGKDTFDDADRATATATSEENSLEDKSFGTSATSASETTAETDFASLAIFGEKIDCETSAATRRKSTTFVRSASSSITNGPRKEKFLAVMIDQFKQIAGTGGCFCQENLTHKPDCQDPEDEDSFSTGVNDDATTLDSRLNEIRMYM